MSDSRQVKRAKARGEEKLKKDFRSFLFVVWKHLGLPPPTPIQYDIARYMQHGPQRKMVQAYRGAGKTWIFGAYIAWRLFCNPDIKIMVVSASKPYADDLSKFIKTLIWEMPILDHLKARPDQRQSNVMFDVGPARTSKDPSVKSVGIFGQLTGSRADEILADDVESLNNSSTEAARHRLSEAVKEFDAILKPGGRVTYLGTPQSAMTMYAKLPERGYTIRIWPIRIPANPDKYSGQLAPYIMNLIEQGEPVGSITDIKRFSEEDMQGREMSYGKAGFALQFMLDTSSNDAYRFPLKLKDLMAMPLDLRLAPTKLAWAGSKEYRLEDVHTPGLPGDFFVSPMFTANEMTEYTGCIMAIDPSGRGTDETAYAVAKHLNGTVFVPDAGGVPGGYDDEAMDALVARAKLHNVNLIIVEDNFGGGMFQKLLQSALIRGQYRCAVEGVTHSKQKELRIIDTLEPIMMQHRLVICQNLINRDFETAPTPEYSLFWQMARITRDRGSLKHEDRLDVLSMAVRYWVDQMGMDTNKAYENHREKMMQAELKKFAKHVFGQKRKKKRWVDA